MIQFGTGTSARIVHMSISNQARLRTPDGRYVFVTVHPYWQCPTVYQDRDMIREVEDWFDDDGIGDAVEWYIRRGCRG